MAYENDRDRHARLVKEFWSVKEKACRRCGVVQPNAYTHFGKKRFFDLYTFVTVDVCRACMSKKQRERWARLKWEDYDYRVFKVKEAIRRLRIERGDDPEGEWTPNDKTVALLMMPTSQPDVPRPE